jgi:hypothetical protein
MRACVLAAIVVVAAAILPGCQTDSLSGAVTVVVTVPALAGMNAGSNAADQAGTNRAVSDSMVLDSDGVALVTLHMNGSDVVFPGGTMLTVYCTVWVGPQSDNAVRYTATKDVTISGDKVVVFSASDNTLP